MRIRTRITLGAMLIVASLAGCGGPAAPTGTVQPTQAAQAAAQAPTSTQAPTRTVLAGTATVESTATATLTAVPGATPAEQAAVETTAAAATTLPPEPSPSPSQPPAPAATKPPAPSPVAATPAPETSATPADTAVPLPLRVAETDNILVLGTDTRPGPWTIHTDSIMLVAIDHEAGQVGVLSIPRDLWVNIPGWGQDRINAAYYAGGKIKYRGGGAALARRVVGEVLGIPIQHTVLLKMDGVARLVDAIGGVTVRLECPLYEATPDPADPNKLLLWSLPAGEVTLDGATAKKFVTYRYLSSDFSRARRQQQLLWAMRDQALKANLLPRIPELWAALSDSFETDLGLLDVIRLASIGVELKPENVHGAALDRDVVMNHTTAGGASVLLIKDQEALRRRLSELFAGRPLSELGKSETGKCPPAPPGFAGETPTPAPTGEGTPAAP